MKKLYTFFILLLTSLSFGQTPIGLLEGLPYYENFNGMGALTTFPNGWAAIDASGTLGMTLNDGSTGSGGVYNVGLTAGDTDRAFGTIADGTTTPVLGAVFQNITGSTVSKIAIRTRMEQWKESGNAGINEKVAFSYSTDATSLSTGNWTPVTTLDFNEKLILATANSAVNGNLTANQTYPIQSAINLNWANGTNLWIRWADTNDAGANGLYAIDDFEIAISTVLGVKQNAISGLNMYPNPVSNGTLYITSNSSEAKSVAVYDALGKQVLNAKTSNSAVNVSNLKGGIYFVKITEEGKTDTRKLIIQ